MANCCLSHPHLRQRSCANTTAWALSGLLAPMPASVEPHPALLRSGGGRLQGTASPSSSDLCPRVLPNSPLGSCRLWPQLSSIFRTQLQRETALSEPRSLLWNGLRRLWGGGDSETGTWNKSEVLTLREGREDIPGGGKDRGLLGKEGSKAGLCKGCSRT